MIFITRIGFWHRITLANNIFSTTERLFYEEWLTYTKRLWLTCSKLKKYAKTTYIVFTTIAGKQKNA